MPALPCKERATQGSIPANGLQRMLEAMGILLLSMEGQGLICSRFLVLYDFRGFNPDGFEFVIYVPGYVSGTTRGIEEEMTEALTPRD